MLASINCKCGQILRLLSCFLGGMSIPVRDRCDRAKSMPSPAQTAGRAPVTPTLATVAARRLCLHFSPTWKKPQTICDLGYRDSGLSP
ncbi:hypothetical protein QUA82_08170 [Microcoleus sp. F8-D3]